MHKETLGAGLEQQESLENSGDGKTLKIDTDMEPPLNNLVRSH